MARPTKFKVPVATLLANAEAHRQKLLDDYKTSTGDFPGKSELWRGSAAAALEKTAAAIRAGKKPQMSQSSRWSGNARIPTLTIDTAGLEEMPLRHTKPSTLYVDRHIALLKATADETITVDANSDMAAYLTKGASEN